MRTCKFRSDGQRQIDGFHLPGEIFGFGTGATHRLSAEAVCDSAVVAYRWRAFTSRGDIDDRLVGQFFVCAMQSLRRAQEHSLLLGRRGAAQRVAAFLVEMADRAGCYHIIDLPIARQDIADYLGLTIETVCRTLSNFERECHHIAADGPARVREGSAGAAAKSVPKPRNRFEAWLLDVRSRSLRGSASSQRAD